MRHKQGFGLVIGTLLLASQGRVAQAVGDANDPDFKRAVVMAESCLDGYNASDWNKYSHDFASSDPPDTRPMFELQRRTNGKLVERKLNVAVSPFGTFIKELDYDVKYDTGPPPAAPGIPSNRYAHLKILFDKNLKITSIMF